MFEPVLQSEPITSRLWRAVLFTADELRHGPQFFLASAGPNENQTERSRRIRLGSLVALAVHLGVISLLIWVNLTTRNQVARLTEDAGSPRIVDIGPPLPPSPFKKVIGEGGNPGGGGNAVLPASHGQPPINSPVPPIVKPDPSRIPPKNIDMPVAPTIQSSAPSAPQTPSVPLGVVAGADGPPSPGSGPGKGLGNGPSNGSGGTGPGGSGGRPGGSGEAGKPGSAVNTTGKSGSGGQNGLTNSEAKPIYRPKARSTDEAIQNKIEGEVIIYVEVLADGTTANPRVLHSLGFGLDEEAIKAALQAKFRPKIQNGRPVPSNASITFSFHY